MSWINPLIDTEVLKIVLLISIKARKFFYFAEIRSHGWSKFNHELHQAERLVQINRIRVERKE